MSLKFSIARVDPLRRKSQQKILVEFQASLFEYRPQNFIGGSGIGRRFQDYELSAPQTFLDLFGCRQDERYVGLFSFSERCRHADDDRVALLQMIKVGGGPQT